MLAACASCIDAATLPFTQQLALKPGKARHHREHEGAGGRRSVNPKIQDAQVNAALAQRVSQKQYFNNGPAKTADLGHYEGIASSQRRNRLIQQRACPYTGRLFDHQLGGPDPAQRIDLTVFVLVVCRDTNVPDNPLLPHAPYRIFVTYLLSPV